MGIWDNRTSCARMAKAWHREEPVLHLEEPCGKIFETSTWVSGARVLLPGPSFRNRAQAALPRPWQDHRSPSALKSRRTMVLCAKVLTPHPAPLCCPVPLEFTFHKVNLCSASSAFSKSFPNRWLSPSSPYMLQLESATLIRGKISRGKKPLM